MTCPQQLRVQAWFDGELDAGESREIEQHLQDCAQCRDWHADLRVARDRLRALWHETRAPAGLRQRILQALPADTHRSTAQPAVGRSSRPRSFWFGVLSGAGGMATAATLALLLWLPGSPRPMVQALVAEHVRSLQSGHPVAVVSSDHHTVKPWFAGRADVSPVVQDFASQGFTLIGGRADALGTQRAAVLVYRHQQHLIDVFSWAEPSPSLYPNTTRAGYHLLFWRIADIRYCAVSDAGWGELEQLRHLVEEAARADLASTPRT